MTVQEPSTMCGHEVVDRFDLVPDSGGQMHEVGSCTDCGARLVRSSALDDWARADEER